jgi:hypothetical protein
MTKPDVALPSVAEIEKLTAEKGVDVARKAVKDACEKAFPEARELWVNELAVTGDWWVYRGATSAELKAYAKQRDEQLDRKELGDLRPVYEFLAMRAVLWPATSDLTQLFIRRPLIGEAMAAGIREVSGLGLEVTRKKL